MKKILFAIFMTTAFTGCAKNVDRIDFQKWGYSFVPAQSTSMDTTAQGGARPNGQPDPAQSTNYRVPKASVGGAYMRNFSTSPSYRMVGGFHVTP